MKNIQKIAAAASIAMIAPVAAQATVLTFDLNPSVANASAPGNYGDNVSDAITDIDGTGAAAAGSYGIGSEGATPNVTVDYVGVDPRVWTTGYSDLTNVYYIEPDGTAGFGFTLTADTGYNVTLAGFDIGNYGAAVVLPSITATVDGGSAWGVNDYALGSSATSSQNILPLDKSGLLTGSVISLYFDLTGLGGSSDNIGLDNITFSQSAVSAVPLPAGLPLLLAGLGAFGLVRRKTS